MQAERKPSDIKRPNRLDPSNGDKASASGANGNGKHEHDIPTPWVAAEELQPAQRPQSSAPLDELDEALMESFPCSDPPSFSHAHV